MHTRLLPTSLAAALLFVCGIALQTPAQTITTIQVVTEDLNNDFIPDRSVNNPNALYEVVGRITSPNLVYYESATDTEFTEIYIQDTNDNYAVQVLFNDSGFIPPLSTDFVVGKEARITSANVRQTNGVTNMRPFFDAGSVHFSITDQTILPVTPVVITIANLLLDPERWEGTLVTVNNVTHSNSPDGWPEFGASATLTITDGTGSLGFRIDQDTGVAGQYEPTSPFNLTGIFTQFDTSAPLDSGYQIIPRFISDIDQGLPAAPPAIQFIPEGPLSVAANEEISFDILALDTNDNDVLTIGSVSPPAGAVLEEVRDRLHRFTYTPVTPGVTNEIQITVNDGSSPTVTQTMDVVVLTVEQANIILNELMYDPPSGLAGDANGDGTRSSSNDEFLEIVNNNLTDVDISGWVVRHNQTTDVFTFPASTILTGKSAAVVFGGGTPTGLFGNAHVFTATAWQNLDEDLPGGDIISLHTAASGGVQIFSVAYGTLPAYDAFFTDESLTRDPDFTGSYVQHQDANADRRFSPGTLSSGAAFSGSGLLNVPPELDAILDAAALIGVEVVIPIRAIDGDGDTITLGQTGAPASASLVNTGTGTANLVYTGQLADEGMDFPITITASDAATNDTVSFVLSVVSAQYSGLVINEVLPDPDAQMGAIELDSNNDGSFSTSQDEFVEIVNNTTGALDLAGCMLSDGTSTRHTFPSTIVPVGGTVVVFGGGALGNFVAAPAQVASGGGFVLGNSADTVSLYDPQTNLLDRFSYSTQESANSWTRNPDITGGFTDHLLATGQASRSSPGLKINDDLFVTNQPPQLQPIADQEIREGETLVFSVGVYEPDGGVITLVTNDAPANSSFSVTGAKTGEFTFSPDLTQAGTTTVTFAATSADGNDSITVTIVVTQGTPNTWDFETGLQGWTITNLTDNTNELWERASGLFGGASDGTWEMLGNGFQDVFPRDDWLISPAMDLTTFVNPQFSWHQRAFYSGDPLAIYASTNYMGAGTDPMAPGVTWDNLNFTILAPPDDWEQNTRSLAPYQASTNVYFAFQYVSAGGARQWRIDEIALTDLLPDQPPVITPPLQDQFAVVGGTLAFTVLTEELDGDVVTNTVTGLPAMNATYVDNTNGTADFSFTPDATQVGTFNLSFIAADKDGADTNTVDITVVPTPPNDCGLIISEYIEGSGQEKALELYNGTGSEIDLFAEGYLIEIYSNGSATPSVTTELTNTVASGDVFLIVNASAAAPALTGAADQLGSMFYNGNDAVVLRQGGPTGPVVDSIGRVGEDPAGGVWGPSGTNTAEHTLIRKPEVKAGDGIFFDDYNPTNQWIGLPQDTFTNFGEHVSNDCPDAGSVDSDGDGVSDADEAIAGTSSSDSNDFFAVKGILNTTGNFDITLPTKTNRNYVIQYTDDITDANSWQDLDPAVMGSGGDDPFTDMPTNPVLFYRGDVRIP